jgi:hypothetical protein
MLLNLHSGAGDNQQPGTSRKCMILAQCYVDYMHVNFINCSNIRIKNYFAWLPNPSFLQKYLFWKKKKRWNEWSVSHQPYGSWDIHGGIKCHCVPWKAGPALPYMHACLHVHTLHWLDKLSLMTLFWLVWQCKDQSLNPKLYLALSKKTRY